MKRLFALTALLLLPLLAQAQYAPESFNRDAAWWTRFERQTEAGLHSSIDGVQQQTLRNIVYIATYHRDQVNVSRFVTPLIRLAEKAPKAEVRDLSLAALHAVGGSKAMHYLATKLSPEQSNAVRSLMVDVLNTYNPAPVTSL